MCAPINKAMLQGAAEELQPLREVGSMEKTQFWDIHEIMNALRIANLHGIPLSKLRSRPMLKAS
jgi:hypothetical protein